MQNTRRNVNDFITYRDFDSNDVILTDDNANDHEFEFEDRPTLTLQNIQQCIDDLPNGNILPNDEVNTIHNRFFTKDSQK